MTNTKQSSLTAPFRVGIIFGPLRDLNTAIISYLLTHLNTLQSSFEYEILPSFNDDPAIKDDSFMNLLAGSNAHSPVDMEFFKSESSKFLSRYEELLIDNYINEYSLKETLPKNYILISTAALPRNRYFIRHENLAVLSFGAWEAAMAPPSAIESILTLVVRASISITCPEILEDVHLGTKGCLFDFNQFLVDTRYKVLNGIICNYCSSSMAKAGMNKMIEDIRLVLREQEWLGTTADPFSPASIIAKMGYDLFLTRGLKPGRWETFKANIVTEGTKEIVRIAGAIILAGLLIWLGLQQA